MRSKSVSSPGGRARAGAHVGAACVLGRGEADVQVEPERAGDLVAQVRADGLAAHAPDHLAHQPAVRDGVVAVVLVGGPPRLLRSERGGHARPVEHRLGRQRLADGGEAGAMIEQRPHAHVPLPCGRELGPVLRDRRIEVEQPLIDEAMRADRGETLGRREDGDEGVTLPRLGARAVHRAGPEIDDGPPIERDGERGAELGGRGERRGEGLADALEAGIVVAVDVHGAGS